ncbi:hypothetical protein FB451DRAFT_1560119 [Mycena latifolia]|nr:hypothetical protein FB451DRAFT_1560119 [Mycena latifolia]
MADSSPSEYPLPPLSIEDLASYKNDPISASEALSARPWLLGAEAELARIDEEIRCLESRPKLLLHRIKVYRVALAPHKVLPVDVLREIFLSAALSSSVEADLNEIVRYLRGDPLEIRLIIGRVCSLWRLVSLAMPELWSNLRVRLKKLHHLTVLEDWLRRSGEHPLSLDLTSVDNLNMAGFLATYSLRIRHLSIDSLYLLETFPAVSMDLLETLRVDGRFDSIPDASISVLLEAPRLRSVTLRSLGRRSNDQALSLRPLGIPWQQLSGIHLERVAIEVPHYYEILKECRALTHAHLDIVVPHSWPIQTIDPQITLPCLRKLELDGTSLHNYARFLDSFTLPSLLELNLRRPPGTDRDDDDDDAMYHITALPSVRRLAFNITHFLDIQRSQLIPWSRACPTAVDMCLYDYTMPDPVLKEIAEGSLLPNLEMLVIDSAETSSLLAALQARQRSPHHSTITEVGIHHLGSPTTQEREALADLMKLGVFLGSYKWKQNRARGQIEESARFEFANSVGLYAYKKSPNQAEEDS